MPPVPKEPGDSPSSMLKGGTESIATGLASCQEAVVSFLLLGTDGVEELLLCTCMPEEGA